MCVCARSRSRTLLYALHQWSNLHADDLALCITLSVSWPVHMVNGAICLILLLFFSCSRHWNSQDSSKLDYMAKNSAFRDQINDEPFVVVVSFFRCSIKDAFFSCRLPIKFVKYCKNFCQELLKDLWHKISSNGELIGVRKIRNYLKGHSQVIIFQNKSFFSLLFTWIPFFFLKQNPKCININ